MTAMALLASALLGVLASLGWGLAPHWLPSWSSGAQGQGTRVAALSVPEQGRADITQSHPSMSGGFAVEVESSDSESEQQEPDQNDACGDTLLALLLSHRIDAAAGRFKLGTADAWRTMEADRLCRRGRLHAGCFSSRGPPHS